MSILAYVGLPGHGKSYSVTENVILPALLAGRVVYTNIPLNHELLKDHCLSNGAPDPVIYQISLDDLESEPEKVLDFEGGSVIVLDEVWQLFPAGMRANNCPEPLKEFLAKHRHKVGDNGLSQEIVLVTQDLAQIAAFARQLVEETYISNKLTAFGSSKKYRIDIYQRAVTGNPPKKPLRQIFGQFKKQVYQFYSSHTQSSTGHAGNEVKPDSRGNVFKSSLIKWGLPFAFGMVALGVFGVQSAFSSIFGKEPEIIESTETFHTVDVKTSQQQNDPLFNPNATASEPITSSVVEVKEVIPDPPKLSDNWRLAGFVEGINSDTGLFTRKAFLTSDLADRYIDATEFCERDEQTLEMVCILDNEIITSYSGRVRSIASTNIRPGEM